MERQDSILHDAIVNGHARVSAFFEVLTLFRLDVQFRALRIAFESLNLFVAKEKPKQVGLPSRIL